MSQNRIPLQTDRMYHIWTHANGSENLFRVEENYRYFLDKYSQHVHPVVKTFAYCLMPNHLHLMVKVRGEDEVLAFLRIKKEDPTLQGFQTLGGFSNIISRQFSNLFNGYTQAYNKRYDRKGSLFMQNFRRNLIDSQAYYTQLIVYIHNNPVHHGFVKKPSDWPFSSYHAYINNKETNISKEEGIRWFVNTANFRNLHQRDLSIDNL